MERFWLAFTHVPGLGPVRLRQLRLHFDSIQAAWFATSQELRDAGMPEKIIENQVQLRKRLNPDDLLKHVEQSGTWVLAVDNPAYPSLLKELDDAPSVLYVQGTLTPQDERAIAMVGTRKATTYGKLMTRKLAGALAQHGITVISGLARGIDVVAHQAALAAGGRTIAVLGSGIDVVYPSEHRHIAEQIVENGAIITEYSPGTKPERGNFPARNRIISGMTLGTVVVEAPERSGALGTAGLAGEYGRDVFAVPGPANSLSSQGTNRLIQDGAKLVMGAEDILDELNLAHQAVQTRQTVQKIAPTNEFEGVILNLLAAGPLHVDELSRQCQRSIQEVNATLTLMELKGLVYQTTPMMYQVTG